MCAAVSIVIPIYNAEKYLAECLGNVVNQTLQDIEIILVNDASTDNSIAVIRECQKQYPDKVVVIDSKENLGAGGARNLGIEAASGEYIGFVDSDDLVDVTMYEKLYAKGKQGHYDVVDCGYYKQAEDMAILHISDELAGILTGEKRKEIIAGGGYIVSKIFRRGLFRDKKLRFRRNVILEDSDFLTYLYGTVHSIGIVKEVLYYYRNNAASSSNVKSADKYYDNIYKAMQGIYEKMSGLSNYSKLQEAVEYELLQMYSYGVNICLKAYMEQENETCKERLKEIARLKKEVVRGGYENPYVKAKIGQLDIAIMQKNDESPEGLLAWVRQQTGGEKLE